MRACLHCAQLIHDAATFCRFCKEPVPGYQAVAPGWRNFSNEYHQATKRRQWDLWQQLSHEERSYAQKTLGMGPPQRLEFTSANPNPAAVAPWRTIDPAGFQLRRLLTAYMLLLILSLALVAAVRLLRVVEIPSLASQGLTSATPTHRAGSGPALAGRGPTSPHLGVQLGPGSHPGPGSPASSIGSIVNPVNP